MDLTGFSLEPLHDDGDLLTYRANRPDSPLTLLARVANQPASQSIVRLEHEYSLAPLLAPEWSAQPLALDLGRVPPVLILDDSGGDPLIRALGKPLALGRCLRIGVNLARAMVEMHALGIVHKDIKPANVLVDSNDEVRLTGFGIASLLPREHQPALPPEVIAGTLTYMSPEQTGRMNRSIDARSDLYSFGVLFYEMLTGAPPFAASDAMQWIHCHIARRPVPATERVQGLPAVVGRIVDRLLAKTAEERYQTALGVLDDLRICLTAWETSGDIPDFMLGTRDASDRLLVPEKLYGRDAQIDALLAAFDRVVKQGDAEVVLVSGYAGIGKSSLVNELQKALVPSRGLFASGKFDQYKRDMPYLPLTQAFQSLVRVLLNKSDAELKHWRLALTQALAPNGQLMIGLIPELALIIGEQPAVPALPPQEARNRLHIAFRRLLGVFARPEHPLALFIDDLQWLDAATRELIEDLAAHTDVTHLLLIGAYRANEVEPGHHLAQLIDAMSGATGDAGMKLEHIDLQALDTHSTTELLCDALRCGAQDAAPLAQLVHEKTGGNPFFLIQFLTMLADEGLLAFDHHAGNWTWDLPRIRAKGFTENVASLMTAKLGRLPQATRETLSRLAVLGNVAKIDALMRIYGEPEAAIDATLWEAMKSGLVRRAGDAYVFAHDRVQESAYALIPQDERAAIHLHIGRALASGESSNDHGERLFDIVNHLNRGAELMTDASERERTLVLNGEAGRRAMNSAAFAAARNYLAQGVALLSADAWTRHYARTFDLYLAFSECEYLAGHFAVADALLGMMLERACSSLDRAKVFGLRMELYQVAGRFDDSFDVAVLALRELGVLLPLHDDAVGAEVDRELHDVSDGLAGRAIETLVDAPVATEPATWTIIDLLVESMPCAFIARPIFYPLITLKAVNLSLRAGNTDKSSFAYGNYALMLVSSIGDIASAVQFSEMSLTLNEKFGNRRFKGKLLHLHGNHINFWRRHIVTDLPILERANTACLEVGDLAFAGYLAFTTVWQTIEKGTPLAEVLQLSERHASFARQSRNDAVYETIRLQQHFVTTLRGEVGNSTPAEVRFDPEAAFSVIVRANFGCGIAFRHIMDLMLAYLEGRYDDALDAAQRAQSNLDAAMALPIEATFHFFHALTLAALDASASEEERISRRRTLHAVCARFADWSSHCPSNFQHRHALLSAEAARLEGRASDAMHHYEEAVRSAREHGFIHHQALAHELAARFFIERGLETIADTYLTNARSCYERWGAHSKVRQLARDHAQIQRSPTKFDGTIATTSEQLDLETVVSVSRAIFSGVDLTQLIHTLMKLSLEHAGANRCLLLLKRRREMRVEAEATASADRVEVNLLRLRVDQVDLPESVLRYVMRASDSLLLHDASSTNPYSSDEYVMRHDCRSILCLPLIKQTRLIGVLYLENNLASNVFTPARTAILRLLASQAAMSLETARLYADLQHAEALLADAQRLSDTGSFDWHVSSGEMAWSKQSFRIFQYDPGTVPTLELMLARVHPDDVTFVRLMLDRAMRERQPFDIEHRLLMPDGSARHLQLVAHVVDEIDDGIRVLGVLKDITTRKQAHAALLRSEHRYRSLFFDMPVGLWQIDAQPLIALLSDLRAQGVESLSDYIDDHPGWLNRAMELLVIEEVNHHAAAMFGAHDTNMLLGPLPWVWRESPGTFRRALESRYGGASFFQETTRIPTLDGRIIDVLLTIARPIAAEDLGIALISLVDLTERIRAQDMLQRLQADFAHAARIATLGGLSASIAHELKQPLAAITMNSALSTRWLDRKTPDVNEARLVNQRIRIDAQRAVDIVDRIRAMAMRRRLTRAAAPLDELIDEALLFLQHDVGSRGVTIERKRASPAPVVVVDRVQLQQVIVNLVVNAMQAMEAAAASACIVTVRTHMSESSSVTCCVEDSGPGLDEEDMARIFQSFFTTRESGMGMGLAICRSIIEAHGGQIDADNASAHGGARFFFTLPMAQSGTS
ncbi:ATP-binding sensor histidine kinase [Caballeronia sp. CLC5]|uniref:ATP-binding sensor histidine kinase n=1 Tax=Caballeronia sp. CLC5 TaxID=2906764 RepID=UPI001F2D65D5|nr:ATP-binding sensor histidine kinase [Caballeronia sp. CLC5]MCE4574715.1 AAA family ATPase [Caballeronia sp. CLC5]